MFQGCYAGRRVWISGHTGFKGAWLAEWLLSLGAEITGFSLPPAPNALFTRLGLATRIHHETGDVRDLTALTRSLRDARPDFVFHLAAQPLVRRSYAEPLETFATNALGTVHLLETLRSLARPCVAVIVTTDKCYGEAPSPTGYAETDALGGRDPYSASKAMAEHAVHAYRASYFSTGPVRLASARAGNVIGGGDWAEDRIVPDCIRALRDGRTINLRQPAAVRPWQHVLEPLSGYLVLARALAGNDADPFASAFNFGPGADCSRSVAKLVNEILRHWPGDWSERRETIPLHEAARLQLSIDKARALLDWAPVWDFTETVARTVAWYRHPGSDSEVAAFTRSQIADYVAAARTCDLAWSRA